MKNSSINIRVAELSHQADIAANEGDRSDIQGPPERIIVSNHIGDCYSLIFPSGRLEHTNIEASIEDQKKYRKNDIFERFM